MAAIININSAYLLSVKDSVIGFINNIAIPILFAIAFLYFIYGVYTYFFLGADNQTELAKGRHFVLWAVIGFAAIVSVWGLVNIVLGTFVLAPGGGPPKYPIL